MQRSYRLRRLCAGMLAGALLSLAIAACASQPDPPSTLYRQLGGKPGISAIVDGMLNNIAHDTRIVRIFADADIGHLRSMLVQQFCAISGGFCVYKSKSMEKAHRDMHITDVDFNALVEDLQKAMDKLHVPLTAQNRLLARMVPMHGAIVYH